MFTSLTLVLAALTPRDEPRLIARVPEGVEVLEGTLRFGPDGIKVAYVGTKGADSHPVTGAVVGDAFEFVDAPVIDAAGEHVAFRVFKKGKGGEERGALLYDGKEIAADDWIGPVSLSPLDGTPAYWTTHGWVMNADGSRDRGTATLVVGKKKSSKWQSCDGVLAPVFSTDGRFVYSVGTKDEGWAVLRFEHRKAKEETQRGSHIVEVWPQPGGEEIVYSMLDASKGEPEEDEPHRYLIYRAAPWAGRKGAASTCLGRAYDSCGSPVYSLDGKRVAFLALRDEEFGVVIDEEELAPCKHDFIDELTFDREGKQLAYVASNGCKLDESNGYQVLADMAEAEGGRWFVVFGASKSEEFDGAKLPRWSPDGKRLAFAAREGEEWRVHVGDQSSEPCAEVAEIRWASDGKTVWFGAQRGDELWWSALAIE